MKYYKLDNQVFAFEADGSQDAYIREGMVRMTDNEVLFYTEPDGVSFYDAKTDTIVLDDDLVAERRLANQKVAWGNIQATRKDKLKEGVYLKDVKKWFHTDDDASIEYAKIGMAISLGIFDSVNWKTMDGSFVKLDETLFTALQLAINEHTQRIYAKAEYHKLMMMETNNPLDYDFSEGW